MGFQGSAASEEGPRSNMDPEKGRPNKGLVIVVVAVTLMLLMMVTVTLLNLDWESDGPVEFIEDDVVVIQGDVVWEDRSGFMETPVEIRSGGNLRIEDSDLKVRLEDLVFSSRPWFSVARGGRLSIESSEVELFKDPRLDKAVTLDTHGFFFSVPEVPYIHRAVDLVGTVQPRMAFDVRTSAEETEVVVAFQTVPMDDLQVLERVSLGSGSANWTRKEVSLEQLAGSIVKLYLIPLGTEGHVMHLSELLITDGGDDLPIEPLSTGDPVEDLWGVVNGESFLDVLEDEHWPDLIDCAGVLEVMSTRLAAPGDINRSSRYQDDGMIKLDMETERGPKIIDNLKVGGDIDLNGGEGSFIYSDLYFITIKAIDSTIEMREVLVMADREAATLYECSGSITATTFMMEYDPWDHVERYWFLDYPRWYALAIWGRNDGGPVEVTYCEFINPPLGIDMTHANVVMEGCVFNNTTQLAIWNHDTNGLGGWEGINATCDLSAAVGHRYFESHDGLVTFSGYGQPGNPSVDDFYNRGRVFGPSWRWDPGVEVIDVHPTEAELYVPTYSVDRNSNEYPMAEAEVEVETRSSGQATTIIDTSLSDFQVEFKAPGSGPTPGEPLFQYDYLMGISDWRGLVPNGTDAIDLTITIYLWVMMTDDGHPLVSDMELEFILDGETISLHEVPFVLDGDPYRNVNVSETLPSPPGLHVVDVVLRGVVNGSEGHGVLSEVNYSFFRADGIVDLEPLMDYDDRYYTKVLVDPGVSLDLSLADLSTFEYGFSFLWATVHLGEGSRVSISGPVKGDGLTEVSVNADGPGHITLQDIEAYSGTLSFSDCTMDMKNVSFDNVEASFEGVVGQMTGCDLREKNYQWTVRSTMDFVDTRMTMDGTYWDTAGSNLTFRDSVFTGRGDDPFRLFNKGNSSLAFEGCAFNDVVLDINVDNGTYGPTIVQNCSFTGDPSGLVIVDNPLWKDIDEMTGVYSNMTIEGNRFTGQGSFLSAHRVVHQLAVGENTFLDGGRLEVVYDMSVLLIPDYAGEQRLYHHPDVVSEPGLSLVEERWGNDVYLVRIRATVEDPAAIDLPRNIKLMVTGLDWRDGRKLAITFKDVDLTAGYVEVVYPYWGDTDELVRDLLEDQGLNFWESGD